MCSFWKAFILNHVFCWDEQRLRKLVKIKPTNICTLVFFHNYCFTRNVISSYKDSYVVLVLFLKDVIGYAEKSWILHFQPRFFFSFPYRCIKKRFSKLHMYARITPTTFSVCAFSLKQKRFSVLKHEYSNTNFRHFFHL